MNIKNKLINISTLIKNTHGDKLEDYTFVYPDDRHILKKGDFIKYVNTNFENKNSKLKSGILINTTPDVLFLKGFDNNFFWKINVNSNHIFYYRKITFRKQIESIL
jgi:hypothetical protein